jgi:AcrR family transcriptional regulator
VAARDRILDAVEALIGRGGFKAVSIASVAAEAGVSRQTVYANFGTLEDLVSEAVTGVSTRVLGGIGDRLETITDPGEYVVELLVSARASFRDTPALAVLVFPETGNPMFQADMFATALPLVEVFLVPLFERGPQLLERRADVLELLLRTGLSVLMFDSDAIRSDADLRGYLTRTLLPGLGL